jgi:hypothetical protein
MNDHGKSDRRVVPTKLPNKDRGGQATTVLGELGASETERPESAEAGEGSRLAKGTVLWSEMAGSDRLRKLFFFPLL